MLRQAIGLSNLLTSIVRDLMAERQATFRAKSRGWFRRAA